jgi:hypothetical protein
MPLADFQTLVDDLVRDDGHGVSSAQRDAAIQAALVQYSADRPRNVVVDVVSPGGQRVDLPAGFTADSRLVGVEYPVDRIPASQLPLSDISVYAAPTVRQLEVPQWIAVGESLRVTYTGDHLVDDEDDTVPLRHRQSIANLAASYLCMQLASRYATEGDPSIPADTVDYKSKSDRFRALAKDYAAAYGRVVGVAPSDRTKAASATVELERRDSLGNRRLFHPARSWPR